MNLIFNESCMDTFKRFEDSEIDVVFTSPPYNRKRNDKYELYNDTKVDYYNFLKNVIDESIRVSSKFVAVNIQTNYYNKPDVYKLIGDYHKEIREIIIWEKSNPMPASGASITNAYEFIIVLSKNALKSSTTYTKNHITTSVNSGMPKNHKAVMKPEVAKWFIEKFVDVGDLVYDPFIGVGTTGIECDKQNVKWKGSELVREYSEIAWKNTKSSLITKPYR